jgi:hypothetical protein
MVMSAISLAVAARGVTVRWWMRQTAVRSTVPALEVETLRFHVADAKLQLERTTSSRTWLP